MSSENASVASLERPGRAARLLLLAVEAYRVLLSPLLGGHCRFWPSCSAYSEEAIRRHGARRGFGRAGRWGERRRGPGLGTAVAGAGVGGGGEKSRLYAVSTSSDSATARSKRRSSITAS